MSINSPDNRLVRDRPYALKSGDLIFIEPYEIDVSIDAGVERPRYQPLDDPFGQDDPFAPVRVPSPSVSARCRRQPATRSIRSSSSRLSTRLPRASRPSRDSPGR